MFRRKDGEIEGGDEAVELSANDDTQGSKMSNQAAAPAEKKPTTPPQQDLLNTPSEKPKTEGNTMSNESPDKNESSQSVTPPNPAFRPQAAPAAMAPAATRPASPATPQAGLKMPSAPSAGTAPSDASSSGKRILTVGPKINMKGEITSCDRLVIEGSVDATLADVDTVEITKDGAFKGKAEVRNAEISGVFDGDLICTERLVIHSTGRVNGTISYSEIEIERGGQMSGTVQFATSGAAKAKKAA